MASEETGPRWWIRYVIIPLIGGGGLVGLLVTLHSKSSPPPTDLNRTPASVTPAPQEPVDQKVQVENLVAQWLSAWLNGDGDRFVSLASEPGSLDVGYDGLAVLCQLVFEHQGLPGLRAILSAGTKPAQVLDSVARVLKVSHSALDSLWRAQAGNDER